LVKQLMSTNTACSSSSSSSSSRSSAQIWAAFQLPQRSHIGTHQASKQQSLPLAGEQQRRRTRMRCMAKRPPL
jgi:hypothetical protein